MILGLWPFRKASPAPPAPLLERLESCEDGLRRLERRFERLQGEFSSLNRAWADDDDDYDDAEDA